jgi:hypothetical protein
VDASLQAEIESSIELSQRFLKSALRAGRYALACQGADGAERFSHNKGHLFVAYFLADAMAGAMDEIDRTILLTRILSEERTGHWGFSPGDLFYTPEQETFIVDADDTAYVLRTLRGLGAYRLPDSLLTYRCDQTGGFVTFRARGGLQNLAEIQTAPSFAGNFGVHPEVTLNVYSMLRGTNHETQIHWPIVQQLQHPEGWWYSYFYPGPFFGTVLACEFLRTDEFYRPHLARTVEFLARSQRPSGAWGETDDPYATSLAVRALAAVDRDLPAVERGLRFLLSQQSADGHWQSSSVIWHFVGASGEEWLARDRDGALVTSAATIALRRCS